MARKMITIKLNMQNIENYTKINDLINKDFNIIALEDKYILVMRKV